MKVYALIIDDRHSDTDVQVFSTAESAVGSANACQRRIRTDPSWTVWD